MLLLRRSSAADLPNAAPATSLSCGVRLTGRADVRGPRIRSVGVLAIADSRMGRAGACGGDRSAGDLSMPVPPGRFSSDVSHFMNLGSSGATTAISCVMRQTAGGAQAQEKSGVHIGIARIAGIAASTISRARSDLKNDCEYKVTIRMPSTARRTISPVQRIPNSSAKSRSAANPASVSFVDS